MNSAPFVRRFLVGSLLKTNKLAIRDGIVARGANFEVADRTGRGE